jgi:hypothetical protein
VETISMGANELEPPASSLARKERQLEGRRSPCTPDSDPKVRTTNNDGR